MGMSRRYILAIPRWTTKAKNKADNGMRRETPEGGVHAVLIIVEIAAKEETPADMCFACFNLGNNSFFIDRMIVKANDGTRNERKRLNAASRRTGNVGND